MSSEVLKTTPSGNWALLRAGVPPGGGLEIPTIPTDVSAVGGRVRLAIGPGQEPRVLLPLANRESPPTIQGGSGLTVCISSFRYEGRTLRFLDLICRTTELEPVFEEVVDEMLGRIARGVGCVDAARSTIEDFRSLLMRTDVTAIGKGKIAGLVAELLVLNRLLDRSSSAWRAWNGPTGNRHDFRAGDTSLEVKATLGPGASTVTINGLEQLEVPTGGSLHLLHIVLEPVSGGMLSVSGLARTAMAKADDPERLSDLLAAVGCNNVDAEEWNRHRFRKESECLFEIRTDFPRLTPSMLPDGIVPHGVHGARYQIDLSVAASFMCDPTEHAAVDERLAS